MTLKSPFILTTSNGIKQSACLEHEPRNRCRGEDITRCSCKEYTSAEKCPSDGAVLIQARPGTDALLGRVLKASWHPSASLTLRSCSKRAITICKLVTGVSCDGLLVAVWFRVGDDGVGQLLFDVKQPWRQKPQARNQDGERALQDEDQADASSRPCSGHQPDTSSQQPALDEQRLKNQVGERTRDQVAEGSGERRHHPSDSEDSAL